MKRLALLAAALLGCATAHPMMMPSGQRGWYIKCHREESCFARAQEVCPSGYRVVRERPTNVLTASTFGDTTFVQEHPGSTLMIECSRDE